MTLYSGIYYRNASVLSTVIVVVLLIVLLWLLCFDVFRVSPLKRATSTLSEAILR
jgi:hypothetical protein